MIPLSLSEVAAATGATPVVPEAPWAAEEVVTAGVSTDSRSVEPGMLFAAIRGERADGHAFLGQVFAAGAAGALVDAAFVDSPEHRTLRQARPEGEARLLVVDDPVTALGRLARESLARLREAGEVHVIGITGSVGKTTTKDLVATILRGDTPATDARVISPPGSFNNELGLPLTVLRATADTRVLVLEMGADHIGNIADLTSIAPPDVAVVLAVARAHLGEFGGIDAVAQAKAEMVRGALPEATLVLNADDPRVAAMAQDAALAPDGSTLPGPRRLIGYGRTAGDLRAQDVHLDETGRARFRLVRAGEDLGEVHLGLVGEHHIANALAAAAIALALGVAPQTVVTRLSGAGAASPHRMAVTERPDGVLVIDDSYNANPDSTRAALAALDTLGARRSRRIAVLGVMLELGDATAAEHRSVGAEVAARGIDVLIAVGREAEDYLTGAMQAGARSLAAASVPDAETAELHLSRILREGDVVLVKGSNGSGLWRLADRLVAAGTGTAEGNDA